MINRNKHVALGRQSCKSGYESTVTDKGSALFCCVLLLFVAISTPALGESWTPAEITNTVLWFDASDASTILTNNMYGRVSQWSDKSTNGWHATQGVVTYQPSNGVRTIGGLNALYFEGGIASSDRDFLQTGEKALIPNGNSAVFIVYDWDDDGGDGDDSVWATRDPGNARLWKLKVGSTSQMNGGVATKGIPKLTVTAANTPYNDPTIFSSILDWDNNELYTFANGGNQSSVAAYTAQITANQNFNINRDPGSSGESPYGTIGEIIVCEDVSEDTRLKVEGYLAWKWGLQDNLPVSHSYRDAPPFIGVPGTVIMFR